MTSANERHEERDILAGEYVLGLLEGADADAATKRLEADAKFAASVERWRRHFALIDQTAPEATPSRNLWPLIEAQIDNRRPTRSMPAARRASLVPTWWNSLPLWRSTGLAAGLLSLVLAVGLAIALHHARRQPELMAILLTDANEVAAVVQTFADGRAELMPLQHVQVPAGRALQIWTLWDKAVGPLSVGLIDQARSAELDLSRLPLGSGQLFEITVEPAGGSPSGRPTGPIVAKGTTARRL